MEDKEQDLFRLDHVLECTEKIGILVSNLGSLESFLAKWIEQDAMIRNFEVIGEAVSHISDTTKGKYPEVEWYKARALRNYASHEYFQIKLETIWNTAVQNVPVLKTQIGQIIADLEK